MDEKLRSLGDTQQDDCTAPEDRLQNFQHWSCDQYDTFMNLQLALTIDVMVVKSVQVIIFLLLVIKLIR